jgi:hypothetical protein
VRRPSVSTAGSPSVPSRWRSSHGAARVRRHAASAVLVYADAAVVMARLPAPVPFRLPGPARSAEGPAVGAQQPRSERAQRAGRMVATAHPAADGSGRGHAAHPRLDRRGLRGPGAVRQATRASTGDGRALRRRARSGRRAGRRGTHGGDPHRPDRPLRPHRPARCPRQRACRGRLQDRAARAHRRRRPQLAGARDLRAGRRPLAAPALYPGGTASSSDR